MDSQSQASPYSPSHPASASTESERILEEFKLVLKEKKLVYKQIAERIGLTEGAIKKTLTADDLSIQRLGELCDAAGITLRELFRRIDRADELRFTLTSEQEDYFAKNPKTLRFFLLLLDSSAPAIQKSQNLSPEKCLAYLDELTRMGLVEGEGMDRRPKTQAKILKWNPNGSYARTHNRKITHRLTDHLYDQETSPTLFRNRATGYLLPATQEEFAARIKALSNEFMSRARKENSAIPRDQLKHVSWAFLLGEFDVWSALLDGEGLE